MATYDFDQVLVWDVMPGGGVRTLRNGTVSVVNPATSAVIQTVTSDSAGRVAFATTDVPTVVLRNVSGFERRLTSSTAIEAAAGATVSNDASVAALVGTASSTRSALDARYAASSAVSGKVDKGDLLRQRQGSGALGNNVADDTAAIQAALDAAAALGGGVVYAPPGAYCHTGLLMPSHVTLSG